MTTTWSKLKVWFMEKLIPWIMTHKWIAGLTLVGIIFIIGFVFFSPADPEELVDKFEMAVATGDVDTLSSLIKPDHPDMKIDKEDVQNYLDYLQKNGEYYSAQTQVLRMQGAIYSKSEHARYYAMEGMTTDEILASGDLFIRKKERVLIPDTYVIAVRPYYLEMKTNEEKTDLSINGKKVYQTKKDNLKYKEGPLFPGVYNVRASKKFEYATVTTEEKAHLLFSDDQTITVDVNLVREEVELDSDIPGTQVFVNGKSLGKIEDHPTFGPVSKDGSVKIHGEHEFPWGKSKSSVITVEEDTKVIDVTPNPVKNKTVRQAVTKTVNQYAKDYTKARLNLDPSVHSTITDNMRKTEVESINDDKNDEAKYEGQIYGTRINFGTTTFAEKSGKLTLTVPVEFHTDLTITDRRFMFRTREPEEKYSQTKLILIFDEKKDQWLVDGEENDFFYEDLMEGNDVEKSTFK